MSSGWTDLIPIGLACIGAFVVLRCFVYASLWAVSKAYNFVRDRRTNRAARAHEGRDLLVQRMDGLESRMDTLEGHMAHIIDLLERREAA